jgi:hypothetical protein
MPSLKSAVEALEKALDHARKGKEFYSAQVDKLEKAIATIKEMDIDSVPDADAVDVDYSAIAASGRAHANESKRSLPRTGQEFWLSLITAQAKPASHILADAIKALGIDPTEEERKKLANRLAIALFNATKAKHIKATGPRRSRLYSR